MHLKSNNIFFLIAVALCYAGALVYISVFDNGIFSDFGYPIHNGGDSSEYATLTQNLVESGTFTLGNVPEMFRSPGYSFFLAPLYAMDSSFYLAIFVQVLLVIASAVLVYEIGVKFLPPVWASICGLFYALDPTTIFYSLAIFSDTLFVFLMLLSVWLLFIKENRGWGEYALAGLVLGYAALVRSAGEYLIFIIAAFALFEGLKRVGWKKSVMSALLLVVAAYAVLTPWYVRNFEESGALGLSTTGPQALLLYDVKDYEMKKHGVTEEAFSEEIKQRLGVSDLQELRNVAYSKGMMDIVKEKIFADPLNYGIYHVLGGVNLFLGSSIRDASINLPNLEKGLSSVGLIGGNDINVKELFAKDPLGALWYAVSAEPLFTFERILRLAGLLLAGYITVYALVTRRFSLLFLLMVSIVAYTALVIGPVSYPRYRMPLEPFLYLITALGALQLTWNLKGTSVKVPKS